MSSPRSKLGGGAVLRRFSVEGPLYCDSDLEL
jgi:hypothetical protein